MDHQKTAFSLIGSVESFGVRLWCCIFGGVIISMANDLLTNNGIQNLVIGMELLVIGVIGILIVYLLSRRQPKQTSRNSFLYILMMALVFYAIFYLKDPLEFIPQEVWNLANYVIIVITIYGFYRQIVGGFRAEFNDRLNDFKDEINTRISDFRTEIRRDFDRIEKSLENISEKIESTRSELHKQKEEISEIRSMFPLRGRILKRDK